MPFICYRSSDGKVFEVELGYCTVRNCPLKLEKPSAQDARNRIFSICHEG
jgi:hypothetical protein